MEVPQLKEQVKKQCVSRKVIQHVAEVSEHDIIVKILDLAQKQDTGLVELGRLDIKLILFIFKNI